MQYQNAWHPLQVQVLGCVRRLRRARRGRPRADEPVREVEEFVIQGQIGEPDPQRVKAELRCRGSFVLITSEDAHRYPAERLLQEYRGQQAVEQRFRFLKDPLVVQALYLHTPSRIEALGYVMIMAGLVYSILEHRVRHALLQRRQEIVLPGKRRSSRPTASMLLAMCQAICVARLDRGPWMFSSTDACDRVANLVELAGLNFATVYAAPGPPVLEGRNSAAPPRHPRKMGSQACPTLSRLDARLGAAPARTELARAIVDAGLVSWLVLRSNDWRRGAEGRSRGADIRRIGQGCWGSRKRSPPQAGYSLLTLGQGKVAVDSGSSIPGEVFRGMHLQLKPAHCVAGG